MTGMRQHTSLPGTFQGAVMAEPTSSGVAGLAGWKLIGGAAGALGIGAALATVVAMCLTLPRTLREWAVALISTVVSSLGGGALVIVKFGLLDALARSATELDLFVRLLGVLGVVFTCGLPGWTVVRWTFNWLEKRKDADLSEIVGEVRGVIGGGK
jgi:hypothetical protein